jgi:hypothetical protein
MDWISFLWGVGALLFVNAVYTIWALPKQLKRKAELNNKYDELVSTLEKLESSFKLRKSCPVCGAEFSLYILEEKVNEL